MNQNNGTISMQNSDPYIISHSELQSKTRKTTTVETATQSENKTLTTDSLNLDLLALQKEDKLNGTTLITVHNDPVYHSTKRYEAVPLLHL
jgi:hypothetical protein